MSNIKDATNLLLNNHDIVLLLITAILMLVTWIKSAPWL